ncbi:hypothetical protein VNO77_18419 [Canavalia gladiata]|uniref:Uncharacterized protein n=1 Tax=Canavalia gladiata TaxID=3824 RepID=A0AAN9QJL9_CANGL
MVPWSWVPNWRQGTTLVFDFKSTSCSSSQSIIVGTTTVQPLFHRFRAVTAACDGNTLRKQQTYVTQSVSKAKNL